MLALFCLLAFFGFGVLYFKYWVIQKPFGIILFVGEGLDAQQLAAARIVAGGADKPLTIDSLRYSALLKNYSSNSATPDAAAAATALATGVKVNNGSIAIDVDGNKLQTLLELARDGGRLTGLVTNGSLTSPTAASFYAHAKSADNRPKLALQLVQKAHPDVVLGGGLADFLPEEHGGHRTDHRDLVEELGDAGYEVVHSLEELAEVPRWRRPKLFGIFADAELPFGDEAAAGDDQPTLVDMVRRGIELLQFHRGGYLIIVDAALSRKAAEGKDAQRRAAETVELDRAVAEALSYAGPKSMILVAGDVAIREPLAAPAAAATPAASPEEVAPANASATPIPGEVDPAIAAAAASPLPAAPSPEPTVPGDDNAVEAKPAVSLQTTSGAPTAEDVVAFGTGLGANTLHGIVESTVIFDMIRDNL